MIDVRTVADRRLRSLLKHWLSLRSDGRPPSRDALDPLEMPWALGHLAILEVDPSDAERSRFRLFGCHLADLFHRDLTMRAVSMAEKPAEILRLVRASIDLREPIQHLGQALFGPSCLQYEYLFLPISSDGETIDMILTAAAPSRTGN